MIKKNKFSTGAHREFAKNQINLTSKITIESEFRL